MMGVAVSNISNTVPVMPINQNLQMNNLSAQQPLPMMQMQHSINQNDLISSQNPLQPPLNPMNMLGHPQPSPPPQSPLAAQNQPHLQLTPLQMQHLQHSLQSQNLQLNQQNQQINQQQLNQLPLQTYQVHHNNLTLQTQQTQRNEVFTQIQPVQQEQQLQPTQVQQQSMQQETTSQPSIVSNFGTPITSSVKFEQIPDATKMDKEQQTSTVKEVVDKNLGEIEMVKFSKPTLVLDQEEIINKEKQIHPAGASSSVTADISEQGSFSARIPSSKSLEELEVAKVITEIASVAGGHYFAVPNPPGATTSTGQKTNSKGVSESKILEYAENGDTQSQPQEIRTLPNDVPMTSKSSTNKVISSTLTPDPVPSSSGSQIINLDKRLPKAMVKPNILTHIIDGFVIQEASEPFAVSRPVQEWLAERAQGSQELNREEPAPKSPVRNNVSERTAEMTHISEEVKCHCGKPVVPPNKKFCSQSCSKKSQSKKRSVPAKPSASALSQVDTVNQNETNANQTSNLPPTVESPIQNGTTQEPAALKWNVEQVADFIRKIPGCAMYAEEFILQEVDGEALILIKPEHLVMSMSIKLGPALKIVASIDTLRPDKALSEETPVDEVSPSTSNKPLPVFPQQPKEKVQYVNTRYSQ